MPLPIEPILKCPRCDFPCVLKPLPEPGDAWICPQCSGRNVRQKPITVKKKKVEKKKVDNADEEK